MFNIQAYEYEMTSVRKFDALDSSTAIADTTDPTKKALISVSGITTATTRTFTMPDESDTLVGLDIVQTLTNKTIDTANNTLTVAAADVTSGTFADARISQSSVTQHEAAITIGNLIGAPTSAVVGISDAQTLTNKTISTASNTLVVAAADVTSGTFADARISQSSVTQHEAAITIGNLSGAPTGAVVGTSDAQTLTNKTIDTATNTITVAAADVTSGTFADARISQSSVTQHEAAITIGNLSGAPTGAVVGTTDAQTLTNKTLGDNLDANGNKIIGLATPTADGDAATKSYVDGVASGLDVKDSVVVATTQDLDSNGSISGTITYTATAGASGRGQITATLGVSDTFTVDSVSLGAADDGARVLLKDQTSGAQNGIWTTTISGTSLTLDRATDFDTDAEVTSGAFTFVEEGTVNADSGWTLTTNDPITIGGASGTALTFAQFSGAGSITAGDGLSKTGNTLDVDAKANGGIVIEANELAVDLGATSITGTLAVADGGTGATTHTSGNFLQGNGTGAVTATKAVPTGVVVGTTDTQTLTGKTLTAPRIGTSVLDTNGNELLLLTATASAVNELTLANAATAGSPTLSATGGDANISIALSPKGTGTLDVSSAVVLSGSSAFMEFPDVSSPANPGAGLGRLYKKTGDDGIYWKPDAAGPEVDLTSNSGEIIDTVTTTDATTTTIATLATSTDISYFISVRLAARRTDAGSESGGYEIKATYRNNSGTLSQVGSDDKLSQEDTNPWNVETAISGTDIIVRVTGQGGKTINWKSASMIVSV